MSEMRCRTMIVALTLAAAPALSAAPVGTPTAQRVAARPDLYVQSAKAERLGVRPDGQHRVRVTVAVRCAAPVPTTCGAFKILAERLDIDPTTPEYTDTALAGMAGFTRLGEAGVASLSSGGGAAAAVPLAVRTFDDNVPSGRLRQYRIVADSGGAVAETDERNNVKGVRYRAVTCAGSDVVLTRVELVRQTNSGGTLVHVWVRNRCSDPCVANLVYTIDEHEAVPGGTGVEQPIGTRLDGDVEVGPLGNVVAAGQAGHDATYTVAVEARGGPCREISTANNSCRVTIRAGETSRTFSCNP